MYVLLYLSENADAEVFGPFPAPQRAIQLLRRISAAAGLQVDISHSNVLATVDISIDGERHRYQLRKLGSPFELDAHAESIEDIGRSDTVSGPSRFDPAPPSVLSGY